MNIFFKTPQEMSLQLAGKLKALRLSKKWKQSTLAKRSGVTQASLRRFEQTGKISMENFLKLIHALGRLDEMESLMERPAVKSLNDLRAMEGHTAKRGSI
ncbi:MAG: helix-turn-helix domain-containing protein [Deltaproteobacteria bacterium]|jgi:HTH-type transcriptional regulator/antitoxin HipB|nr:helix-turn-helix domain-containing protein [Deltaproteobacteria bacterium]